MTCPLDPLARQLRKPLSIFYAYCLMSNHLHLLLREFQDRFRSEPVDSLEYFVTLLRYIHQNPLKAGIVIYWTTLGAVGRNMHLTAIRIHSVLPEKPVSDSEIKSFLVDSQGIVNPLMVQSLEKSRRNEVLRTMLSLGAGIRQLSRLTGVSFGVIQKLAK